MNHQLSDLRKICLLGINPVTSAFAAALKNSGFRGELFGVDSEKIVKDAWGKTVITDGSPSLDEGLKNSDLVALGESKHLPEDTFAFAVDRAASDAVMLDMISNRHRLDRSIAVAARRDLHYIGFHIEPTLGTTAECSANIRAFFSGKTVLLTPQFKSDIPAAEMLTTVFVACGASVHSMNQDKFDERHAQFDLVSDVLKFLELETILRNCRPEQVVTQHLESRISQQLDYCSDSRKSEWLKELADNRAEVIKVLSTIEATVGNLRTNLLIGSLDEHVASVIQAGRALLSKAVSSEGPELIVNTGDSPRVMQAIATAMAEARIAIDRIERLTERGDGYFKLRLLSLDERARAESVLRTAGIETEQTD